jgi:hypothetical protein
VTRSGNRGNARGLHGGGICRIASARSSQSKGWEGLRLASLTASPTQKVHQLPSLNQGASLGVNCS